METATNVVISPTMFVPWYKRLLNFIIDILVVCLIFIILGAIAGILALLGYDGFALWFGGSIPGLADHKSDDYDEEDDVLETHRYYKELYNKDDYQPVQTDGLAINSYSGGYYFLFSESSPRAGQVGLFLTETYGQEVSKFRSFTDYLSFLVTDSPEPELVDVDYKRILDIIED